METTVSTSNRFRRNLGSFATTINNNNNNNRSRPEKEQCLFDIYKKEGDHFFVRRKYKKAVDSYSAALTHKEQDLTVLIARSRCYANMGQFQQALVDAETALTLDSAYTPAMYQKAQVLYSMGQYDMALLFFHKGRKLNPNAPDFTEGVEKAQSALIHLTPECRMKTTEAGDLSMYIPRKPNFTRRYQPLKNSIADREPGQAPLSPSFRKRQVCKLVSLELQKKPPVTLDQFPLPTDHNVTRSSHPDPSTMRDVLSQLYTDKAYFEKILRDMENSGRFHEDVFHMAGDGLAFIAERMLFWARFGTPAPPSPLLTTTPKHQRDGGTGLKPFLSARQGRGIRFGQTTSTDEKEMSSKRMALQDVGDVDDEDEVTWGVLREVSAANILQEQEMDIKRRRKRVTKAESKRGKRRVSVASPTRKPTLRKGRTKEETGGEKGEDATDARKLKFKFDTYRPSTQQSSEKKKQAKPVVPPLVRTVEDLSTDEWDSEWDECEETEAEATTRRRHPPTGQEEERTDQDMGKTATTPHREETLTEDDPVRLYLVKAIRDITAEFDKEGYMMVREKALDVLNDLGKYKPEFMANKLDLVATLHSLLGNAYLEVSDLDLALRHHKEDLRIGEEKKYDNVISRGLGNLGRTHVLRKEFSVALECFAGKSNYVSTTLEKTWLYHEISNCFLQLRHFEFARDAAAKALDIATHAQSTLYQLQAAVLLAVSEVQLKKYDQAHEHFTLALDQAMLREDTKAESAIRNALQQLNQTLAAEAREKQSVSNKRKESTVDDMEKLIRPSLADEEHPELADLKETDADSVVEQEQYIINAATALVAHSARRTRQPIPPTWDLNPHQGQADSQPEQPSSSTARREHDYGKKDPHSQSKEAKSADEKADDEGDTALNEENKEETNEEGQKEEEEEEEEDEPKVDPIVRHLAVELKRMEEALKEEDAEGVTAKGQAVLDSNTEEELHMQPYLTFVAKLHSFMGTAAIMLEEYQKAQDHHQKDLDIGDLTKDKEIQARALDNLGRVHVLQKHYDKALEAYVRRLEMNRDDDTSARIFHEIANCFFHVQHYTQARDSARLAVQHAAVSHNSLIQLQSSVLMAVCHVKESQNDMASTSFEKALDFAVQRDDQEAEEAIKAAIRSLKTKVQQAADKFKQGLRGNRMANRFFPMTDWVTHMLNQREEEGQGQRKRRHRHTTKEIPEWRFYAKNI